MLGLIRKSDLQCVQEVLASSRFEIHGDVVSPAEVGWESEMYYLAEILPADLIPIGYAGTSTYVEVSEDGVPKYVWNVVEIVIDSAMVNVERDQRIATGFQFIGKSYRMDSESKPRIIGAATLAGFAIGGGAQPGDYHWHGDPDVEFGFIADDNTKTIMDAQTCFTFGQMAAGWESKCIFAARAIKDMNPIPSDYQDNKYWP